MSLETRKINDIAVKPIIQSKLAKDDILGYNYFPTLYSNIYICSKRTSGKTTLIYNILKHGREEGAERSKYNQVPNRHKI